MLISALLLASLATPQVQRPSTATSTRQVGLASRPVPPRRGSGGRTSGLFGGSFSTGVGPRIAVVGMPAPGVYQVQLDDPGTGWQESVLIGVPSFQSTTPVPLLVMFHAYSTSEWDCWTNGNGLFQGALNRGWYVVAPLGAHQKHFGIPYSQVNIEYALSLFTQLLPVDPDRLYGVGFSMGAGALMSYASRHHDLARPRFAAVTNHTGSSSVAFAFWNASDTSDFMNPALFGGSPATFPFLYSQSSALDIDASTAAVDTMTDLVRNLAHVPVLNYHAQGDPLVNLVLATQVVFSWLGSIPTSETYLLAPAVSGHQWSTADANTVLNYMGSKTLQTPRDGEFRVLADRDAHWFHFYVHQDAAGAFTPFRWNMEPLLNRLTIDETLNLERIEVNTASIGLDTAVDLQVVMGSTDGLPERTTLDGYAAAPQAVLRAGISTNAWTWDPVARSVTLLESNSGANALWTIRP